MQSLGHGSTCVLTTELSLSPRESREWGYQDFWNLGFLLVLGGQGAALRAPPHDADTEVQEVAEKLLQGEGLGRAGHDRNSVAGEL